MAEYDGIVEIQVTCENWFQESKKFMESGNPSPRERVRRNQRLYYNDITLELPARHTQLKFNLPLSVVETELPIISDYLPTFDVVPIEQDDEQWADGLQRRKQQIETKSRLKRRMLDTIKDSLINSDGIICIMPDVDRDTKKFKGLSVSVQDFFSWFPAPESLTMDFRKSRYQIFAMPMHKDEVRKTYGVEIEGEGFIDEYRSFREMESKDSTTAHDMVLLKMCFWMDDDKATYPFGRHVIWANGKLIEDVPLWDGANIDPNDNYIPPMPYFKVSNYGTAHSLFGVGETFLVSTQTQCLNEIMSSLAENVKKSGNPIRKVLSSWVKQFAKKIQGIAGEQVEVNSMGDIAWDTPPNIPASFFEFINLLMRLCDVVTGVQDVTQGRQPSGITAAAAIEALQEAANSRVRFKISGEISDWIEEIGRYIIWILKTYDTEITTLRKKTEQGENEYIQYDPSRVAGSKFDIEVVAGSRMPTGRYADDERAKEKFAAGIYGIEDYVNASNEPNKKQVIEGYYQRQGLKVAMDRQKELNEAHGVLEQYVTAVLDGGEDKTGSPEEEQIAQLLSQYPELLQTQEFQALPAPEKERLVMIFAGETQQGA